ncbi:hypothetical protein MROS_0820 [Melioribacter roseus P3M-2]|uniref:DUF4440 domain-containing protein n=1 Tax=Melioribacter roseus (strain DSM 23840 / JCM 17771 / VKM B-2668 / P3M-2) TaxID=1191523 RepID=I7A2B1_MELRP|nr:hypothetical protein [Melioribacter roseus]AFN74061.1 hypothetical protein MROS_0820 [Melioribacter roseus P3M-2]
MLKKLSMLALILFMLACTKEVPESDKNIIQTTEKKKIVKLIETFYDNFNRGNIDSALTAVSKNYKGIVSEAEEISGVENYRKELFQYKTAYPEGRWKYSLEELFVRDGIGYVILLSSFVVPDPVEAQGNPIYSERSMKVLVKNSEGNWKIYRSVSVPVFTY